MVEFKIYSDDMSSDFLGSIPKQIRHIQELFKTGQLFSCSLNKTSTKMWAVFLVENESELMYTLNNMPLSNYMEFTFNELSYNSTMHMMPAISLN